MLRPLMTILVTVALFATGCSQETTVEAATVEPTADVATATPAEAATAEPTLIPSVQPTVEQTPTQEPTPSSAATEVDPVERQPNGDLDADAQTDAPFRGARVPAGNADRGASGPDEVVSEAVPAEPVEEPSGAGPELDAADGVEPAPPLDEAEVQLDEASASEPEPEAVDTPPATATEETNASGADVSSTDASSTDASSNGAAATDGTDAASDGGTAAADPTADSGEVATAESGDDAELTASAEPIDNAPADAAELGDDVVLPAAYEMSSIQPVDCPSGAQASRVSCYIAQLPIAADAPEPDAMVDLMVAVVDNGDPSGVGPVFYLQGGPGVGSVQYASRYVGVDHDVVLVDQRGNGASIPKLACEEVDELWVRERTNDLSQRLQETTRSRVIIDAYGACAERLRASGIDLNAFNTTNSADDFALIRQLLGYDEWSIWGVSYGTRLGLTIMRDHPEGIRAAVLDSVVPFEVDFFATIPENGLRSMTELANACDAAVCGQNHGDFMANLGALAQRLDREPVVITATRPASGEQFPFRITGEELLSMVFVQLYSTDRLRSLPRQIARADYGGLEEILAGYVSRRDPEAIDLALGSYYTTWCREEFPFFDDTIDDELLASGFEQFGRGFAAALSSDGVESVCNHFNVEVSDRIDNEPIESPIPTLVMAGRLDPITPPAWSKQVADALPRSHYIELADHGHGMTGSCTAAIRLRFLVSPSSTPDATCAAAATAPRFE